MLRPLAILLLFLLTASAGAQPAFADPDDDVRDVFRLIGERLHLSVKTVGSYRARILEKTGWRNNTELTKYCVQHELTDLT